MSVLFLIRTIAVTIFEVDAEILDRLPLQLFDDARVDDRRDRTRQPDRIRKRVRIRRMIPKRALRKSAELDGGVRFEQMRAAVDRVYRLAMSGLSRKSFRERRQWRVEKSDGGTDFVVAQHHRVRMIFAAAHPTSTSAARISQLY